MIERILYQWFSKSIPDHRIDEKYLKQVSDEYLKARGKWKKIYTKTRISYSMDKYIELYGIESYRSIAGNFITELEIEKKKSMAKIQELMKQFMKTK
jgi:hypothetical protein